MDASVGSPVTPRPLDLGGIISASFRVYRDNYLTFVIILAAYQVPIFVINAASDALPDLVCVLSPLLFFVTLFGGVAGTAAIVYAAGQGYTGGRADAGEAYRAGLERFFSVLGAQLLILVVTMLLCITIVGIPVAFYLGVRWSMSVCAVMIEGLGARTALSRSTDLVRGSWWRVFGIGLVFGLIFLGITLMGLISVGIGGAFISIVEGITAAPEGSGTIFASLGSTVLTILIGAFTSIGLTVLYYDLWTREGLRPVSSADSAPPALPWEGS